VGDLFLDYESEGFPATVIPNARRRLVTTWDDILWAAITVGRPDIFHHITRYGTASVYEAIFRWSMVRTALQQRGLRGQKPVRTDLFKQMDPTEKGAINYFLGLLICKLFASKLLNAPWTLHLDVFRRVLNAQTLAGRSRPDMVAYSSSSGTWHAFECKGRASVPGETEKQRAKTQALRLVSVGGVSCVLHIGAITFFKGDSLEFYWRDPEPSGPIPIHLPDPAFGWRAYFEPIMAIIRSRSEDAKPSASDGRPWVPVEEADLEVTIHPKVAQALFASDWERAVHTAWSAREQLAAEGFQPDGLLVRAGPTWFNYLHPPAG
jgi:hypothetical protein